MPLSISSVHGLRRDLVLDLASCAGSAEDAMARFDRSEIEAVCRHLLGDIRATRGDEAPWPDRG